MSRDSIQAPSSTTGAQIESSWTRNTHILLNSREKKVNMVMKQKIRRISFAAANKYLNKKIQYFEFFLCFFKSDFVNFFVSRLSE